MSEQEKVLKLHLNLPALERLMGTDREIELSLSNQVLEAFAKRHLRTVMEEPAFKLMAEAHAKGLAAEVKDRIGEKLYDYKTHRYVSKVREDVEQIIYNAMDEIVDKAVAKSFDAVVAKYLEESANRIVRYEGRMLAKIQETADKARSEIEKGLDERMTDAFERRVQVEVNRRLTAAAKMEG